MKRLFSALLLALLATVAQSAGTTANVSWVAPVLYTDGTTLTPSEIDHYTINWTLGGISQSQSAPAGTTSAVVTVNCGSTSFDIQVTTTATARYPNAMSGHSALVPYATGVQCVPTPPTGLKVT